MVEVVHKRLVYTVDSSDLPKAANDVQRLGSETQKASAVLAAAKASLPAKEYRALAASMAPAIAAEKDLARVVRETERALKPMVAEQRKIATEHLKADAILQKRALSEQKAANALRMRHDTEYRNAQSMLKVQADVTAHVEKGNLSLEAGNNIIAGATTRYRQLGTQARLTQNQMLNLSRQANDSITMAAMGMSPGMIIASQAGQVFGALEENARGVRGSLEAIGSGIASFARSVPTAAYAVAGVTAAVGALYYLTKGPEARSAEESVKSFEDAVRSLRGAWSDAGDAAEEHYRRATAAAAANPVDALLDAQAQVRRLQEDFRNTVRDLNWNDTLSEQIIRPNYGGMSEARLEIRDLYAELMRGEIKAADMAARMREIRMDPANEGYTRNFADQIRIALEHAIDLENQINAIGAATEGLSGKGARVFGNPDQSAPWALEDRFGGVTSLLDRFDPGSMDAIREGLRAQAEEITKTDDAANEYAKSLADLRSGWSDSLGDLQRQVEMYGQTEGAIAAARFEHEALAEARKLAADAGELFDENGSDAARIREVANEVGALTGQLVAMREAAAQAERVADTIADLDFQNSLFGMSNADREIATTLRQLQVSYESMDGQRIAGAVRYRAEQERVQEQLETQNQFVENVLSTSLDALFNVGKAESWGDAVMGIFADIGRQFQELAKQNLMQALFGQNYTTGQLAPGQRSIAQPGFSGGIIQAANQNLPSSAFIPTPTAAVRQTTQRLAEGVTTSVSRNLLSNMLSAGKSQSHISGLNQEFAVALTNMFSEAPAAVRSATNIYSGFRSVERQAELFRGAVAKYGSEQAARKWVAPPGNSQHNRGMAADLSYGNSTARQWIHANAGRYGLAFPLGHENWHIELAGARRGGARTAVQAVSNVQAGAGGSFAIPQMPVYAAPQMSSAAQHAMAQGWAGFGPTPEQTRLFGQNGRISQFVQSPLGQLGLQGIGAFGTGYSSGSAGSGALMGGAQAFLASGFNPIAGAVGLASGPIGGKFGKKEKRV